MGSAPPSPSHASLPRPPVAKHPSSSTLLKQLSSSRNVHKMDEKAANHDAMMKKFNLRKMSDSLGIPSKFSRGSGVVIDKAIGRKLQRNRRFSLGRSLRSMTGVKARRNIFRMFTSPITPKSWPSTCHGILTLAVYHFQLIYLPFFSSYFPTGSFGTTITAIALEFVFLLDLLLNFNTAYMEQGVLITSRSKIAWNYIRTWFVFDLLSAFPLQLIFYVMTGKFTQESVRGVQITLIVLRLLRATLIERGVLVSRVMRVATRFTEWIRYSRYSHLLGIANLMWLVLLIAHYMACFWHVVSDRESVTSQSQSVGEKYIVDYYYAVSLIQGQGNAGGTVNENLFSSVAIIGGSVILAIVFGNVAMLVSNFNANTTNYHRKMEAVYETMEKMDLPLRLRERVNEYYKHVWLEYESLDGNINKFQKELTHTLGIEIGLYKHMDLVVQVPFWNSCTPDFLTQIVLNLSVRVYMPDDYVVRRREIGSEMMMINRGFCKLYKPSGTTKTEDEGASMSSLMHSIYQTEPMDFDEVSEYEDGSSDGFSSDNEGQEHINAGMFGSSSSKRWSKDTVGAYANTSDFTDVRRFRSAYQRRLSYPEGAEKKAKTYHEYMHPGQAFGEMSLLMNYKRTANIRAITFVEMCILSRTDFQNIISRYPEDRRRVLLSMLEKCIETKVIPFPWESIIKAAMAKRRTSGKKDTTRANVVSTMTAKEAACILVEAIDINTPDESIKYGFQNSDQEFVADSSLRRANSIDAKINDTLNRRRGSVRLEKSYTRHDSRSEENEESTANLVAEASSGESDRALQNLIVLVQNLTDNVKELQQEVSDLKQEIPRCCRCKEGSKRPVVIPQEPSPLVIPPAGTVDYQVQIPRKTSLTPAVRPSVLTKTMSTGVPMAVLRRIRSKMTQEVEPALPPKPDEPISTGDGDTPGEYAEPYSINLSGRS